MSFDQISQDLSEIFIKYLKYKKNDDLDLNVSEMSFFLQSDQGFVDLCGAHDICDLKVDIDVVRQSLSLLKIYIEKESIERLEKRLENIRNCLDFSEFVQNLLDLIIENYERISKSLNSTWKFVEELMDKINQTHSKVIDSFGDKVDELEADSVADENVLTLIRDINKDIIASENLERLKAGVMTQMDQLMGLVEKQIDIRQNRMDAYSTEINDLQSDFKDYREQTETLRTSVEKYRLESITDYLTGLYNRKYMNVRLEEEQERYGRSCVPFSIVMVDIDDFKKINDEHGHIVGDYVLKYVSKIITSTLRKLDVAFRYGGEEFLILLPETDLEKGCLAADRLKKSIKSTVFKYKEHKIKITVSQGVAEAVSGEFYMDTVGRADEHLLKAKQSGKDKVVSE